MSITAIVVGQTQSGDATYQNIRSADGHPNCGGFPEAIDAYYATYTSCDLCASSTGQEPAIYFASDVPRTGPLGGLPQRASFSLWDAGTNSPDGPLPAIITISSIDVLWSHEAGASSGSSNGTLRGYYKPTSGGTRYYFSPDVIFNSASVPTPLWTVPTNPVTGLAWTRADLFNGVFGLEVSAISAFRDGAGSFGADPYWWIIKALEVDVTYDAGPPPPTPTWWFWETAPFIDGLDIGPFYWYGVPPPPFPGWKDDDASPPSPDGWFMSTAAYGGSTLIIASAGGGGPVPRPKTPRTWTQFAGFATGSAAWLGGSPGIAAVVNTRMVYAATDYTVGTTYPPVRIFDGSFDRELARLPPTAAGAVPKGIVSMLAANSTIYVATWDSGSSFSDWVGRVFSLDINTATFTPVGGVFTTGQLPYALAWHNGMLFCGTHRQVAGQNGTIVRIRPGIDPAWTSDVVLTAMSVASLFSWQGTLYAGTTAAAGTFAQIRKRATDGTWSTADTGSGGAAANNNGYLALRDFNGALYASFWNNDATAVAKVRKTTDGTTWTTAYTGASGTLRPFHTLFVDNGELFAIGGTGHLTAAIVRTDDGTTWTDLTAEIPETDKTMLPAVAVLSF